MNLSLVAALLLAYLIGSIPTSLIVCRILKGIDIREHGSGNSGATNVYRVMGWKVALFVLVVDALKGAAGTALPGLFVDYPSIWPKIGGGLFAILGHAWTLFARFKGGKGVATALGVFLALAPLPTLCALLIWILLVAATRIVSLGSMAAGGALFLATLLFHGASPGRYPVPLIVFTGIVAFLIIFTHRKNITRLKNGTENRISFGKKKETREEGSL